MSITLTSYSTFASRTAALIGIPYSNMTNDEKAFLQTWFDARIHKIWSDSPWLDVSPYGEARFAGNLLTYPNDLTQTSYWTATAVTPTTSSTNPQFGNPCDNRKTATLLSETSANSSHSISQSYAFLPSVNYQLSAFVRANGRPYVQFSVNDGSSTFTAFFNVSSGVIGSYSATITQPPTIVQSNNGYWLCTMYFTTSSGATGTGSATTLLSTNGSTTSYAGNSALGVYSWGNLLLQTSFASPNLLLIPWDQTGEHEIDAVFKIWKDNPAAAPNPRSQGYEFTPDGVQLVGQSNGSSWGIIFANLPNAYTPSQFPVYLYYRKRCPSFIASEYSASATYAVDDQILFTNSSNVTNFYKCVVATVAGQSPTTASSSWELLEIPEAFLQYCVYGAYSDWLKMDGQIDKALAMEVTAQGYQDNESDRQERQMGWVQPMAVATHVTSQARY